MLRIILQETYEIYDVLYYDSGDSSATNHWILNTGSMSRSNGYINFSNVGRAYFKPSDNYNPFDSTKDYVFEFECRTANQLQNVFNENNNTKISGSGYTITNTEWATIRIEYDATNKQAKAYINGTLSSTYNVNTTKSTFGVEFTDWQTDMDLDIRNWKIYPL